MYFDNQSFLLKFDDDWKSITEYDTTCLNSDISFKYMVLIKNPGFTRILLLTILEERNKN